MPPCAPCPAVPACAVARLVPIPLVAVALVAPRYLAGLALPHLRLPVMPSCALGATLLPALAASRTACRLAMAAALAVVAAHAAPSRGIWMVRQAHLAAVTRALAAVPPLAQAPDEADCR